MSSRAQKKSATRASLIDAAARLFTEGGVDGTTMDDIAREAGTSRTSVFNYFGYKEMILCEVGRRLLDEVATTNLERQRRSVEANLRGLADGIAEISARHPYVLAALAREVTHPDVVRRQTALKRTGLRAMIEQVVDQLAAGHRLRHPGARATYGRQLIDLVTGPIVRAGGEFPPERLRAELRRNVELFLEGASLPEAAAPREMVAIPVASARPAGSIAEEMPRASLPTGGA